MRNRIYILFLALSSALSSYALGTKADADSLYKQENYEAASAAYEQLLKENGESPEVYYNLGNAYYKLENIPYAILNYERSLLLNPGDNDARKNLAMARGKTEDKVNPPSEMFFVTWWHDLTNSMSMRAWTTVALLSFILLLAGILASVLLSTLWMRKAGVYLAMAMFFVVIVANFAAYSQHQQIANRTTAIVISPTLSVKSSPTDGSTDLFLIHEGAKLEILDSSMQGWRQIKFDEGKQGWVKVTDIEII